MIDFSEFKKVELCAAKIEKVEDIEGKDKLYKLEVSLGEEKRTLVAGIKPNYSKEELQGKTIIVVKNLKPAKIAGIESNGMLLAAVEKENISLIVPDREVSEGTKIE